MNLNGLILYSSRYGSIRLVRRVKRQSNIPISALFFILSGIISCNSITKPKHNLEFAYRNWDWINKTEMLFWEINPQYRTEYMQGVK